MIGAAPAPAVLDAYAHCAEIARRSGSSFLAAFWMFPRAERRALHAIYAFCRLVDDIADDPALRGDRGMLLELLADRAPGTRVVRLGLPDRFLDHAEQDAQWKEAGIDADAIARAAVGALRACERAVVRRPEAAA